MKLWNVVFQLPLSEGIRIKENIPFNHNFNEVASISTSFPSSSNLPAEVIFSVEKYLKQRIVKMRLNYYDISLQKIMNDFDLTQIA